ncbi:MAG: hypothetical protein ACJA2F_001383, partial [Nitriliruptoraceae bacterium]
MLGMGAELGKQLGWVRLLLDHQGAQQR